MRRVSQRPATAKSVEFSSLNTTVLSVSFGMMKVCLRRRYIIVGDVTFVELVRKRTISIVIDVVLVTQNPSRIITFA